MGLLFVVTNYNINFVVVRKEAYITIMNDCKHKHIIRRGTIEHINGSRASVRIQRNSACALCEAAKNCAMHESKDMVVEVWLRQASAAKHKVGDMVTVELPEKSGLWAVVIGFVAPMLLVVLTLICADHARWNETMCGCAALCSVGFYYVALFCMRGKIEKLFRITETTLH